MNFRLEQARSAHREALERLEGIEQRIAEVDDDDSAEVKELLTKQFAEASRDVDRCADSVERLAAIHEARQQFSGNGSPVPRVTREPRTYEMRSQHSFFVDLYEANLKGDLAAKERLARHKQETRDLTSLSGSAIDFVPPQYLGEQWTELLRASRPLLNVVTSRPLPPDGMRLDLPRVVTGSAVAPHSESSPTVQETDPDTDTINVQVVTVAGQVDVSRQSLERSTPGLDQVIFRDLVADYAMKSDQQAITGSGSYPNARGILNDANRIQITWTQASPTGALFNNQVLDGYSQIASTIFRPPTHLILHPRRWAWLLSLSDTTGRPLVVPSGQGFNQSGTSDAATVDGIAGTWAGLNVVVDGNLPTNLGAGTNQDPAIVTRAEDNVVWEANGGPFLKIYEDVLSGELKVRLQAYGYMAFTSELRPKANAVILGTGMVPPTFTD